MELICRKRHMSSALLVVFLRQV
ncbi:hypothetical protein Godav_006599 [Gossypium davidsonii]|uniref:Uncharacterized protein n=1 Tax=Gossypium davidsonii TaxID=34287 RepID=A0A7J8S5W4_GOSDV|nr:hypothetical protein [Gossypium davidsonii]